MVKFFKPKANKQSIGQQIQIDIVRIDLNGAGIGYYQNKPVFVDHALVHERVSVKIIEQKAKYFRAELVEILQASDQRIAPLCLHFGICGGCDLQHMSQSEQVAFKQQKITELFHRNGIDDNLPWQAAILAQTSHYRRKARIGVQYSKKGDVVVGFRQKGTNKLTRITRCPMLELEIANIFVPLKQTIEALSLKKVITHIDVIRTEVTTLVFRHTQIFEQQDLSLLQQYAEKFNWHLILDDGHHHTEITGSNSLRYVINNQVITFGVKNFIQVNHRVNTLMVSQALDWLSLNQQDSVLDLYCGLGNFSLPLAKQVGCVVAVEGVDAMVEQAKANANLNQITNVAFYQANLEENWLTQAWAKQPFTKALLDPARAGAQHATLQLSQLKIAQILYVSCDPATLARDAKVLLDNGYVIDKIAMMDMFSQTKHVETMVLFSYHK